MPPVLFFLQEGFFTPFTENVTVTADSQRVAQGQIGEVDQVGQVNQAQSLVDFIKTTKTTELIKLINNSQM